jgi:hypothetical protein
MTPTQDIAKGSEEAAATPPAPEPPAPARPRRGHQGHQPKLAEVVPELRAEGAFLPNMRPGYRNKLVLDRLIAKGHRGDLPSPRAIQRYFENEPRS